MWLIVLLLMVWFLNRLIFVYTAYNISCLLQPLEFTILEEFIPAIADKSISDLERDLFSLPCSLNGGPWFV